VTIKDVDNIPDSVKMSTPVLFPDPGNFLADFTVTCDETSGQLLSLSYNLRYRYVHCAAAGGLGGLYASYAGLVAKIAAILLALCSDTTLAGALDNESPTVSEIGQVSDPAGNQFIGCLFTLHITQFLEV
jgi:hypothetical protein